jgi:hypothetical protein
MRAAVAVKRTAHNWFINIYIAIPDFQIKTAFRIGADPGFVLYIGTLAAKIGQRHQVSGLAALTFGEIRLFHEIHLPPRLKFSTSIHHAFNVDKMDSGAT